MLLYIIQKVEKGYIMQNYKKHNKILGQCTPNSRTHRWEIIKLGRSVRRFSIKNIKRNLIDLNRIYNHLAYLM